MFVCSVTLNTMWKPLKVEWETQPELLHSQNGWGLVYMSSIVAIGNYHLHWDIQVRLQQQLYVY
jgi:hypothetical protein